MAFFDLSAETRLLIYGYTFGDTTIRYTRPKNRSRARVYAVARQNLGLLTACKSIYLEAHPLYISLIRLVLRNSVVSDIPEYLQTTVLPKIGYLEIDSDKRVEFDLSQFTALKSLKVIALGSERGYGRRFSSFIFVATPTDEYLDGLEDARIVQRVRGRYEENPQPHFRFIHPSPWLVAAFKDSNRKFKIIDTIRFKFRDPKISLRIVYDVDTATVLERVWRDIHTGITKIWKDGKINTYTLRRDGEPGKLWKTEEWL